MRWAFALFQKKEGEKYVKYVYLPCEAFVFIVPNFNMYYMDQHVLDLIRESIFIEKIQNPTKRMMHY